MPLRSRLLTLLMLLALSSVAMGQSSSTSPDEALHSTLGNQMLNRYFVRETHRLADNCLNELTTPEAWEETRAKAKRELLEMLGLSPLPARTELKPVITHSQQVDDWIVEAIHFQSRPGLYVTANLYRPADIDEPLPAVLYVCGHGGVKKDGVSYGNKVHYQHHGEWFARNGYVCLTIDSLQLGEIEGIHHGTHRYGMWWWLNRGYTPAGVEAWNCIRALDYLESRPEVDAARIGVTGRSGGGAYSWWIAAIDERIRCAVPVAGITDLENHVIDGCVEGHCDCMFFVNTFGWDYPMLAAMVAPRPLLISNTDSDSIFPLDGVVRTHAKVRAVYELYGKPENLALQITAGPHKDTQELRIHAFHWLNHFLKDDDSLIETAARPFLAPEDLQVFRNSSEPARIPADALNANIHETFVPAYTPPQVPQSVSVWQTQIADWKNFLDTRVFRAWPIQDHDAPFNIAFDVSRDGIRFRGFDIDCQAGAPLRLYLAHPANTSPSAVELHMLDDATWAEFQQNYSQQFGDTLDTELIDASTVASPATIPVVNENSTVAYAYFAPRGVGRTRWEASPSKQTQIRRRFYLLGQTLDGMQIWDQRQAIHVASSFAKRFHAPLTVHARGTSGVQALYATMYAPQIDRLILSDIPSTHREGPFLLNITRRFDIPHVIAMVATEIPIQLTFTDNTTADWAFPLDVAKSLGWDKHQFTCSQSTSSTGDN